MSVARDSATEPVVAGEIVNDVLPLLPAIAKALTARDQSILWWLPIRLLPPWPPGHFIKNLVMSLSEEPKPESPGGALCKSSTCSQN